MDTMTYCREKASGAAKRPGGMEVREGEGGDMEGLGQGDDLRACSPCKTWSSRAALLY